MSEVKTPLKLKRLFAKSEVEVALVLVLFASVMFWKLLVPVKEFVLENVF